MAILGKQAQHAATSISVGLIAFATSMAALWLTIPGPEFEPIVWDAKAGDPVPRTFAYAMFPRGTHIKLFDHPDGSPISDSDSPTICTEGERESGEYLPVETPEGRRFARVSDLTFAAVGDPGAPLLSTRYRSTTQNQRLVLTGRRADSGGRQFVLRISDLKHARSMVYVWDVVNGAPAAREIRRSDFGTGMKRLLFSVPLAAVSIVVGAFASNMFNRRARRAHEKAPTIGAL